MTTKKPPAEGQQKLNRRKGRVVKAEIEVRPLKVGETSDHPIPGPSFQTVFVLPADRASYDAIVEQMAHKLCMQLSSPLYRRRKYFRDDAVAALASIGITRPTA